LNIETTVRSVDAARVLTIGIVDSLWRSNRLLPLMPDHGKLMHLFLVDAEAQQTIAHLHPLRVHADSFVTTMPAVPAGRYLLFGDLLFQNGAQRTLVDTVDVPVAPVVAGDEGTTSTRVASTVPAVDADDAWRRTSPVAFGAAAPLVSGGQLSLSIDSASRAADGVVRAGRDLRLVVTVMDANGAPSVLQPYMGMDGHAMVLRTDAAVFMHLHPMGTASMTAQAQLLRRERGDTAILDSASIARAIAAAEMPGMDMSGMPNHGADSSSMQHASAAAHADTQQQVAFPFAFPTAGRYRVFVQVKRNGIVETASFDVVVEASVNPA
jgi:hypothetical protein